MGEEVHEPSGEDRDNDEEDEVADGGEEALFGGVFKDAGEDDGDKQGAEKQGLKMAEMQFYCPPSDDHRRSKSL
ncbi:MAG: hypothetical protein WBE86_00220 [Candidatus Acidiferrales bacterium]